MTTHLKGVGYTQTANIYILVYDNAYVGYACGFNSQGDVTVYLPATGEPGWHYIELTYTDHPAEKLPAFHFSFLITNGDS